MSPSERAPCPEESDGYGAPPWLRWLLACTLLAVFLGLSAVLWSLPPQAPGLSEAVALNLKDSGVTNPVTAVLLNFRGYDTFLELAVLLLALTGVWSLAPAPVAREVEPGAVLAFLPRALAPFMILIAGYLLWVGAHAPGGAFQAGAVLAAAGVLLLLTGWRLPVALQGWPLRLGLVLGLSTFIAVGAGVMVGGGHLLEYPQALAGGLILIIEAASTLSIGLTLAGLFLGGRPQAR